MSDLVRALDEYLTLRHALGFKLSHSGRELPRFVKFLDREGASFITTALALRWAQENPDASPVTQSDRLGMVRRFAAWRSSADGRTEIPPHRLLPRRYRRPAPYIYSNADVAKIVSTAATLPCATGLRGLTCSTLFGLLAVTGMRVSEAVALDRGDVDLESGLITIREGKRGKSRMVPIHASTRDALEDYAKRRSSIVPAPTTPAFFLSVRGCRFSTWSAGDNFVAVSCAIGLRRPAADGGRGRGPRLHDLRHRFAVTTLINWYRLGVDVDREIPKLATYLGHDHPNEVYWYLQAVPELLAIATERSRARATGTAP